jgi:predicted 3-demethylubiquinone-9 3-methyltransferase (glyoxalase superfamily)
MKKITPFLWFNGTVEEAMTLYREVFPGLIVSGTSTGPNGKMMNATFELEGQRFIAFDGGPHYQHTPAFSMYVNCESQAEVDEIWDKLVAGGTATRCGWLQDRFGLSWQVIPSILPKLLGDADRVKANRAMQAMLQMQKIDAAALERAFNGE